VYWILDLGFQIEKHIVVNDASGNEEKTHYRTWEKSNRLNLMFMQMSIANNIKFVLSKTDNAKEFVKFLEERSQIADKSLVGTLMSTLTTIKFDGSRTMHEHVIEMINIEAGLKSLGMAVD